MSLLTALLAFAPALAARPDKAESDLAREVIALKILLADAQRDRTIALARRNEMEAQRDLARRRAADLMNDNLRLMDDNACLRAVSPIPYKPPSPDLVGLQYSQAQMRPEMLQAYAQAQQLAQAQQWPACTCVPGRYEAMLASTN